MAYSLKLSCLLVTVVATLCAADLPPVSHHLIVGSRTSGDRLVYDKDIEEGFNVILGKKTVIEKTIAVPEIPENYVITQVRLLDKATDGTGAEPTIVNGGPGSSYVTLKLKSQRLRGAYFKVEVYAKPNF